MNPHIRGAHEVGIHLVQISREKKCQIRNGSKTSNVMSHFMVRTTDIAVSLGPGKDGRGGVCWPMLSWNSHPAHFWTKQRKKSNNFWACDETMLLSDRNDIKKAQRDNIKTIKNESSVTCQIHAKHAKVNIFFLLFNISARTDKMCVVAESSVL